MGYDDCLPPMHSPSSVIIGARWWKGKEREQIEALWFVFALLNAPIPRIAIENPIGKLSQHFASRTRSLQPWQFGHGETKSTCLWLKGLPLLEPVRHSGWQGSTDSPSERRKDGKTSPEWGRSKGQREQDMESPR